MTAAPIRSAGLWRPLQSSIFRNLLIANVVSDVGTFMQSVGAAWLMVSLNGGPLFVALIQTAAALPFFVLALPAGAIDDIFDRRKVILYSEIWMVSIAFVLTAITLAGKMSPALLLVLTFALSAGDAFEAPTWRAVLPELVQKEDLAAASALNGIEFNFARAVGPALGGVLIAIVGVGSSFLINLISFFGVIVVVARWRRTVISRSTPPETVAGATVAAVRFIRYSPVIRAVLLRFGATMFFASGLLALLPSVAHRANGGALGYGALLGVFGCGAVLGALLMPAVRSRWSIDVIISVGIGVFGVATVAAGLFHRLFPLTIVLLICGSAWIFFISLFNVQVLNQAPDWVRARALAITMLVFQGAVALGSAAWGTVAVHVGLSNALVYAGVGTIVSTVLGLFFRLSDRSIDLTPWNHWRLPSVVDVDTDTGRPVLVTVEYQLQPGASSEFISAIGQYGRLRRRDGAVRWGVCRDAEMPGRYLETFIVSSWAEHLRQHDRAVCADQQIEDRVRNCVQNEPVVRHLVFI